MLVPLCIAGKNEKQNRSQPLAATNRSSPRKSQSARELLPMSLPALEQIAISTLKLSLLESYEQQKVIFSEKHVATVSRELERIQMSSAGLYCAIILSLRWDNKLSTERSRNGASVNSVICCQ